MTGLRDRAVRRAGRRALVLALVAGLVLPEVLPEVLPVAAFGRRLGAANGGLRRPELLMLALLCRLLPWIVLQAEAPDVETRPDPGERFSVRMIFVHFDFFA